MRNKLLLIFIIFNFLLNSISFAEIKNYNKNSEVKSFIEELIEEENFNKKELINLFSMVIIQESALKFYNRTKKKDFESDEKRGSWDRYLDKILTKKRIDLGVEFIKENESFLIKAYKKYGVAAHYITAIIGIESFYGKFKGNYSTFDTLATLAFEKNRRNNFFRNELKEFLILSKLNNQNPKSFKGSFAGAMGLAQFIPSSINKLAIDFNKNGKKDLNEVEDSIGSIAFYLKKSGWQKGQAVAKRVIYKGERFNSLKTGFRYKYKPSALEGIKPKNGRFNYNKKIHLIKLDRIAHDELWYGIENFYAITRYNKSDYYAMAVYQLAQKIKDEYKRQIR